MKTNKDYTLHYKVANSDYGMITVPKGTRVTNKTAVGVDDNYRFVDEFEWIKKNYPDISYPLTMDAIFYGINIPKEHVDFCETMKVKDVIYKLEGIKWAVVKSNKNISLKLYRRLNRIYNGSCHGKVFTFHYMNEQNLDKVVKLLKSFKKIKFEIVSFYDKQYGLTQNSWNGITDSFKRRVNELPLTHRYYWFDEDCEQQSVTPITEQQFNDIIYINH